MKKGRKASKRTVRCTMCTQYRWFGNNEGRWSRNTKKRKHAAKEQLKEYARSI